MTTAASPNSPPTRKPPKRSSVPRPSSSVLLISPQNHILLLHRVSSSTSFASAHVFPGGALSAEHDGEVPGPDDPERHVDGRVYRMAAIRETFEESGILLCRDKTGRFGLGKEVGEEERERGRRHVHGGARGFGSVLEGWGVEADVDNLIPFTRWITPANVPKRFTTQMYLYFLPISNSSSTSPQSVLPDSGSQPPNDLRAEEDEVIIPNPTPDGGIEHTAARFLPAHKWLSLARSNRIILFPPQFFLLHLLAPYLSPASSSPVEPSSTSPSPSTLAQERENLMQFLGEKRSYDGEEEVSFADACISPVVVGPTQYGQDLGKGVTVLRLDRPGREVEAQGAGRRGLREWVVSTRFKKEGPRDVDVKATKDVLGKKWKGKL